MSIVLVEEESGLFENCVKPSCTFRKMMSYAWVHPQDQSIVKQRSTTEM